MLSFTTNISHWYIWYLVRQLLWWNMLINTKNTCLNTVVIFKFVLVIWATYIPLNCSFCYVSPFAGNFSLEIVTTRFTKPQCRKRMIKGVHALLRPSARLCIFYALGLISRQSCDEIQPHKWAERLTMDETVKYRRRDAGSKVGEVGVGWT